MIIYDVRKQARLIQHQLADLVGTTQSVIARFENADYNGHSLSMLARVAVQIIKARSYSGSGSNAIDLLQKSLSDRQNR